MRRVEREDAHYAVMCVYLVIACVLVWCGMIIHKADSVESRIRREEQFSPPASFGYKIPGETK
jgi:hypothetical protein